MYTRLLLNKTSFQKTLKKPINQLYYSLSMLCWEAYLTSTNFKEK